MSFIGTVLAIFVGKLLYDFTMATLKVVLERLEDRAEQEDRRIGFGDDDGFGRKSNGAQMRKIGFGENE